MNAFKQFFSSTRAVAQELCEQDVDGPIDVSSIVNKIKAIANKNLTRRDRIVFGRYLDKTCGSLIKAAQECEATEFEEEPLDERRSILVETAETIEHACVRFAKKCKVMDVLEAAIDAEEVEVEEKEEDTDCDDDYDNGDEYVRNALAWAMQQGIHVPLIARRATDSRYTHGLVKVLDVSNFVGHIEVVFMADGGAMTMRDDFQAGTSREFEYAFDIRVRDNEDCVEVVSHSHFPRPSFQHSTYTLMLTQVHDDRARLGTFIVGEFLPSVLQQIVSDYIPQ